MISRQLIRKFTTSALRRAHNGHPDQGGIPGENLPFSIHNRYRLTFVATVFLASGFAIPFLTVRHQLLKQ